MTKYKFKEVRKSLNLTQQYVADQLNITNATYSRYENGVIQPDPEMLRKIAAILGTSVDFLLDIPKPTNQVNYSVTNGDNSQVTTGDITINTIKKPIEPTLTEVERLVDIFNRLTKNSKIQLMSLAYMLLSDDYKNQSRDMQEEVRENRRKGEGYL